MKKWEYTNLIAKTITDQIRSLIEDDLTKGEIKDKMKEVHPALTDDQFTALFSEAFCTIENL